MSGNKYLARLTFGVDWRMIEATGRFEIHADKAASGEIRQPG
jgi:hypothetical protein